MSSERTDSSVGPNFDFQPASPTDTLQHLSAQIMAMVKLLVLKNVFTEDQFNREFVAAKQVLEEANAENRKHYITLLKQWAVDHQLRLGELGLQIIKPFDSQVDVKVLFDPSLPPDGPVMFVRIISTYFAGMSPKVRQELLSPLADYYTALPELPPGSRFCLLANTPTEAAENEACQLFESEFAAQQSARSREASLG